jgi:hypothetical protein
MMAIVDIPNTRGNVSIPSGITIYSLPDELLLHILWFLDIPDLYATARVGNNIAIPKQYYINVH